MSKLCPPPTGLSLFHSRTSLLCPLFFGRSVDENKYQMRPSSQPSQINATWPEKCLQPGVTRCNLEHNHRLTGPLRAGRQDPVLPEELLAEHVSALKEWARIPVAVRTQVSVCVRVCVCRWGSCVCVCNLSFVCGRELDPGLCACVLLLANWEARKGRQRNRCFGRSTPTLSCLSVPSPPRGRSGSSYLLRNTAEGGRFSSSWDGVGSTDVRGGRRHTF